MKNGFLTWLIRFLLGMLMILLVGIVFMGLLRLLYLSFNHETTLWMMIGTVAGIIIFSHWHFTPIYVLGHEFTHWIIAKIFRRRTSKFSVHLNHGSVRVENPNIWIVLGPYIFPIYMIIWLIIFSIASALALTPFSHQWMLGAAVSTGVLYAFHLTLTVIALRQNQPDMKFNGPVFSLVFIIFFNLLFLYFGIALTLNQLKLSIQLLQEAIMLCLHVCGYTHICA